MREAGRGREGREREKHRERERRERCVMFNCGGIWAQQNMLCTLTCVTVTQCVLTLFEDS